MEPDIWSIHTMAQSQLNFRLVWKSQDKFPVQVLVEKGGELIRVVIKCERVLE